MDDQEGSEVFEQIHARSFSGGIHVARLRPDVRAEHSLFTFTPFGEVRLEQTDESFDMRTSQPGYYLNTVCTSLSKLMRCSARGLQRLPPALRR